MTANQPDHFVLARRIDTLGRSNFWNRQRNPLIIHSRTSTGASVDRFLRFFAITLLLTNLSILGEVTHGATRHRPISKTALRELSRRINSLLRSPDLASTHVGIRVVAPADSTVVFDYNSSKLFHPASNMKLFTSAASIALLRPGYEFTTEIRADSLVHDTLVMGNLYVQGHGDPLLTYDDIDTLAMSLQRRGIRRIDGDIVGDISYFDTVAWGKGWMWDDEPGGYQPYMTPLTLNRNTLRLLITPGPRRGDPAHVHIENNLLGITLENNSMTSSDSTLPPLRVDRSKETNNIRLSGRFDPIRKVDTIDVSISKPEYFFLAWLRRELQSKGIQCAGMIEIDTFSRGKIIYEIRHGLDSVLHLVDKESDNLAAEYLLKTISATSLDGRGGSTAHGIALVRSWLAGIGVDTSCVVMADGSGLSYYNLASPAAIVRVLEWVSRHKGYFQKFYGSLSVAGEDGTLAHRFRGTSARGNLHGKTGTLSGASALSGYVRTKDGTLLAFSIMCSLYSGEARPIKRFEDAVVEVLAGSKLGQK